MRLRGRPLSLRTCKWSLQMPENQCPWFQLYRTSNFYCMANAAESLTLPGLQSAALAIAVESLASPRLQLAACPAAIAVVTVLERGATTGAVIASTAIADNAVEGAGTMSKQVAMSSLRPFCHILCCWMDAQMLINFMQCLFKHAQIG
jgi:hypothetical protein